MAPTTRATPTTIPRRSYALLETDKPVYMLDGSERAERTPSSLNLNRSWWWWCGSCPGGSVALGKAGIDCTGDRVRHSPECFFCPGEAYTSCAPAVEREHGHNAARGKP